MYVVRVRRRAYTREHARVETRQSERERRENGGKERLCKKEKETEGRRERERERERHHGNERERDPSFSLARGWGRPFSRVLNIFMMAAGAGGAAWKWRVGGGCRDGGRRPEVAWDGMG